MIRPALILILLTSPALAQRPDTRSMTCQQAASLVANRGAVVLSTGPDIYDRYVRHEGMCWSGYYGRPAFAPTRDRPNCMVGYYCASTPPFPFN